ncbi:mycofactocin precursor MftA [Nocardioides sp.]
MLPENPQTETHDDELATEDLIEEVSIDGMCGVY